MIGIGQDLPHILPSLWREPRQLDYLALGLHVQVAEPFEVVDVVVGGGPLAFAVHGVDEEFVVAALGEVCVAADSGHVRSKVELGGVGVVGS